MARFGCLGLLTRGVLGNQSLCSSPERHEANLGGCGSLTSACADLVLFVSLGEESPCLVDGLGRELLQALGRRILTEGNTLGLRTQHSAVVERG